MKDVDPHERQAPYVTSKVISRCVWPVWAILRNLHMVLWQSTETRITDNRGDLQGQRSMS